MKSHMIYQNLSFICQSHYFIILGRKREICGKTIRKATCIASASISGKTPLNMVPIGTPEIPLIIKTFRPTGGVIKPISVTLTTRIPNHMQDNTKYNITIYL